MARWSLRLILLAALLLQIPRCGYGRRNKKKASRLTTTRSAGAGNAPAGLYPLFELDANLDEEIAFSDGHTSHIQHLGGHGNGRPSARVFHIKGFLGQDEAADLIAEAQAQPGGPQLSGTVRDAKGGEEWRNSEQVWVPRGQHPDTSALVRSINQRTAELTKIPLPVVSDGSIQVARYVSGCFHHARSCHTRS
jgi:hypothetical protein